MEFPYSLIKDVLADHGFAFKGVPAKLHKTFEWVQCEDGHPVQEACGVLYAVPSGNDVRIGPKGASRADSFLVEGPEGTTSLEVVNILQAYLVKIFCWIDDMHQALARHCTCEELLHLSQPMLERFVSVSDSTFSHIAHTPDIGPIEEASAYLIEHGRYSDEVIELVKTSGLAELWTHARPFKTFQSNAINPKPSIEHVYHLNSQYAAHLVMVSDSPITATQEFLFKLLIPSVGTVLNGMWRSDNPLRQRYAPFLSDVLHDNIGPEKLDKSARLLDIPTEGLFKTIVVGDSWKGGSGSYFAQRALTLLPGCWAVADEDMLVVLLHASFSSKGALSHLEEKAFGLVEDLKTSAGVSRKFFDLCGFSSSVREAKVALRYGNLHWKELQPINVVEHKPFAARIHRFKRYFPFFASDPRTGKDELLCADEVASEVLGRIKESDKANDGMDYLVLRTYLRTSCKVKETAQALAMHRNSVAYRLRRVEESFDIDLSDSDEVAFLNCLFTLPH